MPSPQRGYLYIVCGPREFLDEALHSVRTLKACAPQAHATLATDEPVPKGSGASAFDRQIAAGSDGVRGGWRSNLSFKIRTMYECSPYKETFFVDTDTHFIDDCSGLFDQLDYHDFFLAHAPEDMSGVYADGTPLAGYVPYNTGVMLFRKSAAAEHFFDAWRTVWERQFDAYPYGQPAFMEALLSSSCKTYVLRNNWTHGSSSPSRTAARSSCCTSGMRTSRACAPADQRDD